MQQPSVDMSAPKQKPLPFSAIYPLTPMQEGILFHHLAEPDAGVYIHQYNCRLEGDLNVASFRHAWEQVVARQDMLRTSFNWQGLKKPHQIVHKKVTLPFSVEDWRNHTITLRNKLLSEQLQKDRLRGFLLEEAPLIRLRLIRLADQCWHFSWTFHHILLDGWSVSIILGEVFSFYRAGVEASSLEMKRPVAFGAYLAWLKRRDLEKAQGYWLAVFEGFEGFRLPKPASVGKVKTKTGGPVEVDFYLSEAQSNALRACARTHGVTVNTLFQGAWARLLHAYSGKEDVWFGVTISGRPQELPGVVSMVGLFINTLPARVKVSSDLTMNQWLAGLHAAQVGREEYAYSPLVKIRKWINIQKDQDFFESILVFENYPFDPAIRKNQPRRLRVTRFKAYQNIHYPLSIVVRPGLSHHVKIVCKQGYLNQSAIQRLRVHFRQILNHLAGDQAASPARLELLRAEERQQLLSQWNDTRVQNSFLGPIHIAIESRAQESPDRLALVCEKRNPWRFLSYGMMSACADQLAWRLKQLGVGLEHVVGIYADHSPEMVLGLLGILKANAAYLALDPALPRHRVAWMARHAGIKVLLVQKKHLEPFLNHQFKNVTVMVIEEFFSAKSGPLAELRPRNGLQAHMAYLMYTSGSTGEPKGVMVTHKNLSNYLMWSATTYSFSSGWGTPFHGSLGFDGTVTSLWAPLWLGEFLRLIPRKNVLAELSEKLFNGPSYGVVKLTPAHLLALKDWISLGSGRMGTRGLVLGGESLRPHHLDLGLENARDIQIWNEYGPTETTVGCSVQPIPFQDRYDGPIPIGRGVANTRLYVVDRFLEPCPLEVEGELLIGGSQVARGYAENPALTAEKFVSDPFGGEEGARLYKSGDLASFGADGALFFNGRMDRQIKLRGHRIELGEVEAALKRCPGVRHGLVQIRRDRDGHECLVGYIVTDRSLLDLNLREKLKAKLPDYMVPARLVPLDQLPFNQNGKIDWNALPNPDPGFERTQSYLPPNGPIERALVKIWSDVLGLKQHVGINDHFFELGGDSIQCIQVVSRARKEGFKLSIFHIFENPTIRALASLAQPIRNLQSEQKPVTGPFPLTPIQHWFFEFNLEAPHHYNQAFWFQVAPTLRADYLEGALAVLDRHHDALRLCFKPKTNVTHAEMKGPSSPLPFFFMDLAAINPTFQQVVMQEICSVCQQSLNLANGPIYRMGYFRCGENRPGRLLWVVHHLAVDGISWRILWEDLQTAYAQISRGKHAALAPKTTSFKYWAQCLADHAQTERLGADIAYWQIEPSTAESCRLPRDRTPLGPEDGSPKSCNRQADSVSLCRVLDRYNTRALLVQAPRAYNTQITEFLLAALTEVLAEWTESPSLWIDLELHGRENLFEDVDHSRTVGWFTTLFPIRLERPPGEVGDLVKAVKEQYRAVPHRGIGYGLARYLREMKDPAPKLAGSSEIVFNYLGQADHVLAKPEGDEGDKKQEITLTLEPARESPGAAVNPRNRRGHLLAVTGIVQGGRLCLYWDYNQNIHREETIARLANRYQAVLVELIDHCTAAGAGGVTPSDFPLAKLTQTELDRLAAHGNLENLYPLTPLQEGMLFHQLAEPEKGLYGIQIGCRFRGRLQGEAFRRAWDAVLARHDILRTSFHWQGMARPHQCVHARVALPWLEMDWRGLSADDRNKTLDEFLRGDRRLGYRLESPPPMRFSLIELATSRWHFIWSFHHILTDGWSTSLIIGEVFSVYRALVAGKTPTLPQTRTYGSYVRWLQDLDSGAARTYWQRVFAGMNGTATFPFPGSVDKQLANGDDFQEWTWQFSESLCEGLQAFGRRHGLTINTLFQGAVSRLLSAYRGQTDVVFGVTVSGRSPEIPDIETMVGPFINTLPVRVRIPGDDLKTWLKTLQSEQVARERFGYLPLVKILKWGGVPKDRDLFETLFVFENYPIEPTIRKNQTRALRVEGIHNREKPHYPLTIVVKPGRAINGMVTHDVARAGSLDVKRMVGHLRNLLEGLVRQTPATPREWQFMSERERHLMVSEWNDSPRTSGSMGVHRVFEARVRRTPDAVALESPAGRPRHISYQALHIRSNRLANRLIALGVGPERLVGILANRSEGFVAGMLAVLKAGGAYLPLNPQDPQERLATMFHDSTPIALLTPKAMRRRMPEQAFPGIPVVDLEHRGPPVSPSGSRIQNWSGNLAYVMYTSGSTGRPKGVSVTHQAIERLVMTPNYISIQAADRFAHAANPSFDAATFEIWGALLNGAVLAVLKDRLPSLKRFGKFLYQYRITVLWLTAGYFHQLAEAYSGVKPSIFRGIRRLLAGGEVLAPDKVRKVIREMDGGRLINGYGPTENTTFTCCHSMTVLRDVGNPVSIGRPIGGTRVYLCDSHLQPVPLKASGQLLASGHGLARGYHGQPRLTAELFIPNPFERLAGGRLYRTGDLAHFSLNGAIEYEGRNDHQVKLRGHRIELGEIEAVINEVPGVTQCAVCRHDEGLDQAWLTAYVAAERPLAQLGLEAVLRQRLPDYMIPANWVALDRLPLSPTGKIDRRALPDHQRQDLFETPYAAPTNEKEATLAEIWSRVMGLREPVGIHDSFYELGGDSIQSIRIVAKARQAGLKLTVRQIFEQRTIAKCAAIAETVEGNEKDQSPAMGPVPLTPIQHWFFELGLRNPHHFNQSLLLEVSPKLSPRHLWRAQVALDNHHDSLRLRFSQNPRGPVSEIVPPSPMIPLAYVDMATLTAPNRRETLARVCFAAQGSLNLEKGPIYRMVYFDYGPNSMGRLLLAIHHLAVDGVSWRILLDDLQAAYIQSVRNGAVTLPPKSTALQTWARRLAAHAQADSVLAEREYWRTAARNPEGASLPTDRKRLGTDHLDLASCNVSVRGTMVSRSLDQEKTQALLTKASKAYRTQINEMLLAALTVVLTEWTGQKAVWLDLEGHGRGELFEALDLSRTVGWFTTIFPVRLERPRQEEPAWRDQGQDRSLRDPGGLLQAVKEQIRSVPNQGIGYGILRYLAPTVEPRSPWVPNPEVVFNYLGQTDQVLPVSTAKRADNHDGLLLGQARETPGAQTSPLNQRDHLLSVSGIVRGGRLQMNWNFSDMVFQQRTIEQLADRYQHVLSILIQHCLSPNAGGFTPSDFPIAQVSQEELNRLLGQIADDEDELSAMN